MVLRDNLAASIVVAGAQEGQRNENVSFITKERQLHCLKLGQL